MLTLMGAETVEGVAKGGDMETLPNQDAFAIDCNDGRAGAEDGGERVVAHVYWTTGDWPV
jgi:hypothetical protein